MRLKRRRLGRNKFDDGLQLDGAYGIEWEDADVADGVFVLFVFFVNVVELAEVFKRATNGLQRYRK